MSAISMKCATRILAIVALILIVQFDRAVGGDEKYFAQYLKKGKPNTPHIVQRRQNPRNTYMEQRPIDISGQPREVNRGNGDFCAYSSDCASDCCVHNRQHNADTCQRKARKGEYCSEDQVKLNRYSDYCPCEAGTGYCRRGICTA